MAAKVESIAGGAPELLPLGETALIARWGNGIDAGLNERLVAFARALDEERIGGVMEVAPSYCSILLRHKPGAFSHLAEVVRDRWLGFQFEAAPAPRLVEIPVVYGGPDLAAVSQEARLSEARVVELHASREYRVYLMGFLPGFAYLGELDERIAVPRLATPRVRVPAGSVGIAGRQTGVYPVESPGGWRIIGRTALKMFDASAEEPTRLRAGDRVRFVATS